ncbi:MAG: superoxide dismutase [Flavobacteriales bacterium]
MKKREFLKTAGALGVGLALNPLLTKAADAFKPEVFAADGAFTLPALGYAFNALEPNIDAMTMEIHYSKHHQGYVNNLNKALEGNTYLAGKSLTEVLAMVKLEEVAIRNNAGGHYNHSKFWTWIQPGGSNEPVGDTKMLIERSFGTFDKFKQTFTEAASKRFGSGWAWLILNNKFTLEVVSTPNQDNPLMSYISDVKGTPILGIDVWEHAYYLHYQNKRADYINAFFNVINWDNVEADLKAAMTKK